MNFILATLTVVSLSICGPEKNIISENHEVERPPPGSASETIKFKKVPTKWVKITKNSN